MRGLLNWQSLETLQIDYMGYEKDQMIPNNSIEWMIIKSGLITAWIWLLWNSILREAPPHVLTGNLSFHVEQCGTIDGHVKKYTLLVKKAGYQ